MSVEALAVVLHHSRAKGTAKLVLMGVANHEGDGGSWPSVNTLARYANVDTRNVRKALRTLEGMGEITTLRQGGGVADQDDETRPNLYRVNVHCPGDCDGTTRHRTKDSRLRFPVLPLDEKGAGGVCGKEGGGGVTDSSPPDEIVRGGVTPASPGGGTPASPKPSREPSLNQPTTTDPYVSEPKVTRAREAEPWPCPIHPNATRRGHDGPCSACWIDRITSRMVRDDHQPEGADA